jgi:hypothetical protein
VVSSSTSTLYKSSSPPLEPAGALKCNSRTTASAGRGVAREREGLDARRGSLLAWGCQRTFLALPKVEHHLAVQPEASRVVYRPRLSAALCDRRAEYGKGARGRDLLDWPD